MSARDPHAEEIRRRAHQLAAAGIRAALNQWDLDTYYDDPTDQDALEAELIRIAQRLDRQGATP